MKKSAVTKIPEKNMVGRRVAAGMYDSSPGTLANWLSQGRGPKAYKVGRKILYKLEDLERYFTATPILTRDSISDEQK